jgi:hypothetical protein
MRQHPHHQVPRIQAVRWFASGMKIFGDIELRFDRGDDRFGDLVLHSEHVGEVSVVVFRPDIVLADDAVAVLRENP